MVESPERGTASTFMHPTARLVAVDIQLRCTHWLFSATPQLRFDLGYQAEPVLLLLSTRRLRHIH
jgi:hypothetical protein